MLQNRCRPRRTDRLSRRSFRHLLTKGNSVTLSKLSNTTIDDIREALHESDTLVWLGLVEPDRALMLRVQQEFDLHELAVEDAQKAY
jgi:Mg2+ and Co2+ transporter CorA